MTLHEALATAIASFTRDPADSDFQRGYQTALTDLAAQGSEVGLSFSFERMNASFEKWHIEGLPFPAALHRFTAPDGGDPHDHPWAFTSHVLAGGYVEEAWPVFCGHVLPPLRIARRPGTVHDVPATHIHRIVALPQGECWTLVLPGPAEREVRFWRFGDRIQSRAWHSDAWENVA